MSIASSSDLRPRFRARGAFDLSELALYLVAGIILLIGIIGFFQYLYSATRANNTQNEYITIIADARMMYENQPSYTTLGTQELIEAGYIPAKYLAGPYII